MTGKILGKITKAEFGQVRDYPFFVGLQLYFSLSDGTSIGCSSRYTENLSDECKWNDPYDRDDAIANNIDEINKILTDAKCNYVSELIGKPVEVTIEGNCFKDFRILTEVL